MTDRPLSEDVVAANAPLVDPHMNRVIGSGAPRFELYHFALSLCSQKVRFCLMESGATFSAHDINLSMPLLGNYDPAYIRLRLRGRGAQPLVAAYTGRSSTTTEGFDPAVVPTLVDHHEAAVYVDSLRICRHIDAVANDGALAPADLAEAIDREVALVDATPHVALLYGAHPDGDFRLARLQTNMPGVHARKIGKLEQARTAVADDDVLVEAIDAKIAKERSAADFVGTPAKMRAAADETLQLVADLDGRLADGRPWICGDRFTLADVLWTVSLFRLLWMGMGFAWAGHHPLSAESRAHVDAYTQRAFTRPTFRRAVIAWPKTPPSEFTAAYDKGA